MASLTRPRFSFCFGVSLLISLLAATPAWADEVCPGKIIEGPGYRILPRLPSINAHFIAESEQLFDSFGLPKHSRLTLLRTATTHGSPYHSDAAKAYLNANPAMVLLVEEMRQELIEASPENKRDRAARSPFQVGLQKGGIYGMDGAARFHIHPNQLIGLCTLVGPTTFVKEANIAGLSASDIWRCGDNLPGTILRPDVEQLLVLMNESEDEISGLHRSPSERTDRFAVTVTIDLE